MEAKRFYNKWGQLYKDTVPMPMKAGEDRFMFLSPSEHGNVSPYFMNRNAALGWLSMASGMREADLETGHQARPILPPDEYTNEQMQKWMWLKKMMDSNKGPS